MSVPETWAKYSNNNIQRSQSERGASKNMRNEIESVINSCSNDMWQEWNTVNVALNHRSQETTDARNRIQTHLSKVSVLLFIFLIHQMVMSLHRLHNKSSCRL